MNNKNETAETSASTGSDPACSLTTLLVNDLEASRAFYEKALSLSIKTKRDDYIEYESGSMRLALYPKSKLTRYLGLVPPKDDAPPSPEAPRSVLSFATKTTQTLIRHHRILTELGVPVVKEPLDTPWGQRAAFYLDPDGNLVELHTPRTHPSSDSNPTEETSA